MNRHLYHYTIAGILFTAIAGTLLHFAYEYSMEKPLVPMFAPVHESTWEHMKLVFFPSFLYMIAGWPFFMRSYPSYFQAYMTGLFTGTISMVIIFYTYTGIWGNHCLILDILTFLASVIITFSLSYQLVIQNCHLLPLPLLIFLVVLFMICFFSFTFSPPEIAIFDTFRAK